MTEINDKLKDFILDAHRARPEQIRTYPGIEEVQFWIRAILAEIEKEAGCNLSESYTDNWKAVNVGFAVKKIKSDFGL